MNKNAEIDSRQEATELCAAIVPRCGFYAAQPALAVAATVWAAAGVGAILF